MSSSKRVLTFVRRHGRDLEVSLGDGSTREASLRTLAEVDADPLPVKESGSFVFAYCKSCDWTGAARRARDKARRDALLHVEQCPASARMRIGRLD